MSEHALIVTFKYSEPALGDLLEVEDQLAEAIEESGAGEYLGNEMDGGLESGTLLLSGPDAARLFEIAAPILREAACLKDVRATLRYGSSEDGNVVEKRIAL